MGKQPKRKKFLDLSIRQKRRRIQLNELDSSSNDGAVIDDDLDSVHDQHSDDFSHLTPPVHDLHSDNIAPVHDLQSDDLASVHDLHSDDLASVHDLHSDGHISDTNEDFSNNTFEECKKMFHDVSTANEEESYDSEKLIDTRPLTKQLFFTPPHRAAPAKKCCCNDIRSTVQENNRLLKKIMKKLNETDKSAINHNWNDQPPQVSAVSTKLANLVPSSTVGELDDLAMDPQLIQKLKTCVGVDTGDTLRRILKKCMTKELAVQYSYTGLGQRRVRNKREFGIHPLSAKIIDSAVLLGFTEDKQKVIGKLQAALRGARDWRSYLSLPPRPLTHADDINDTDEKYTTREYFLKIKMEND